MHLSLARLSMALALVAAFTFAGCLSGKQADNEPTPPAPDPPEDDLGAIKDLLPEAPAPPIPPVPPEAPPLPFGS